jgi:hypothetical protein
MKKMMLIREDQDAQYITILNALQKYEDHNIEYYAEGDTYKRVLTHPDANGEVKERVENCYKTTVKNPYREAYLVLKGELLDLKGMSETLQGREMVVKQQSSTESKKRSDQQEMEKLQQGKTTLKSIFKSSKSKEGDITKLQGEIELATKDIADYKKLIHFLTIYHGQVAINKFKREKSRQYLKLMHNMSVKEISNSHAHATLWHYLMEMAQKNK